MKMVRARVANISDEGKTMNEKKSFLGHLNTLRWPLIRSVIAIISLSIVCFIAKKIVFDTILFSPIQSDFITFRIFHKIAAYFSLVEEGASFASLSLQNIHLPAQFMMHIKVSILFGFILSFPYIIWEIWRYIKPALREKEKKTAKGFVFIVSSLFFTGVTFGYFVILPMAVLFLGNYQVSESVPNNITLSSYYSMVFNTLLSSGIIFNLPVFIYILSTLGIITSNYLRKYRRHIIVLVFIMAAIITPSTDMITQVLVALPVLLLFEVGIWVSKRAERKAERSMSL